MRLLFSIFCMSMASSSLLAQQAPLLDLPNISNSSQEYISTNQELELLSPNEILELYDGQVPSNKSNNIQDPITADMAEDPIVVPELPEIPETSYSRLVDDLSDDTEDQNSENQKYNINRLWSHQSVMLLPKEVQIFNAALARYVRSLNAPAVEVVTDEPADTPIAVAPEIQKIYPFIALNSIMYINPDQWTVWINRKRYVPSNMEALEGIKLVSVSKNTVTIHWTLPPEIDLVEEVKPRNPFVMSGNLEFEEESFEENIDTTEMGEKSLPANVTELEGGKYAITLSSNQVFISKDLAIHEGRAATARIKSIYQAHIAQKRKLNDTANITINGRAQPMNPSERKEQQDINQLLELYKKSGEMALPSP